MGPVARLAALSFLTALLAACTSAAVNPPTEPVDANGDWVLESGNVGGAAIPIVADHPITFSVEGAEVGGQACNFYGGRLEHADGGVRVGLTSSTQMACGEPDDPVMRAEAVFMQGLGEVRAARVEADRLTLAGPAVELVFARRPPIPFADIVEVDWVLESVTSGDVVAAAIGEPAPLRYDDDGTFHGGTGCRTFQGRWIIARGRLRATDTAMAGECPGGLGGQDQAVAEGVGGSSATIEGERLILTMNGGTALVYRRATE